jgi:hypothetical protein
MSQYRRALKEELDEYQYRLKEYERQQRTGDRPGLRGPENPEKLREEIAYLKSKLVEARGDPKKQRDLKAKVAQEEKEAQIAALNSTTLGQKLPEDVIRKVSEYGGRKKKTRKTRVKRRKTRRGF